MTQIWLRAQAAQPATLAELQSLLDAFAVIYNTRRPHRSLPHQAAPTAAYADRPKAQPGGRTALMLIQDLHVRIINAATGELIRELVIDPDRDYQPLGRRPGRPPTKTTPNPIGAQGHSDVLRHHTVELRGLEPLTLCLQSRCSSS